MVPGISFFMFVAIQLFGSPGVLVFRRISGPRLFANISRTDDSVTFFPFSLDSKRNSASNKPWQASASSNFAEICPVEIDKKNQFLKIPKPIPGLIPAEIN